MHVAKPEYSYEDLKHIEEEEEEEEAAAAAAKRPVQSVGEDEKPEPAEAGVNWCCRCMFSHRN